VGREPPENRSLGADKWGGLNDALSACSHRFHSFFAFCLFRFPHHAIDADKAIPRPLKNLRRNRDLILCCCGTKSCCTAPSSNSYSSFHSGSAHIWSIKSSFDGQRCSHSEQAIPLTQSTGLYAMSFAQNPMSHRHSRRAMFVMPRKTPQVPVCREFKHQLSYRRGSRSTTL